MRCDGEGCDQCDQGFTLIANCPLNHIDLDAVEIFRMAQAWKRGIAPTSPPAYLDQPAKLMALIEYEQAEEDRVKAALRRRATDKANHG